MIIEYSFMFLMLVNFVKYLRKDADLKTITFWGIMVFSLGILSFVADIILV